MEKEKSPYGRSFGKRLTWRIMIVLFVVMAISALPIYIVSKGTILAGGDVVCNNMIKEKADMVEHMLSDVCVAVTNTVPVIEESLGRPEKIEALMERVVKLNPLIRSCGISFVENYYPRKGRLYCPYAVKRDSTIEKMILHGRDHDYLEAPWFTKALQSKDGFWSDPFLDGTDKTTPLVSYMVPIHDRRGRTVAVLGADLSLNALRKEVINIDFGESFLGYFIVDTVGTYIVHSDTSRMVKDNIFKQAKATGDKVMATLGERMTEGGDGELGESYGKEKLLIDDHSVNAFYHSINHIKWSMCMMVSEIYFKVFGYLLVFFMLSPIVIGLIVIFFVGRRTIRKAVEPIKQLAMSTDEVAKGHFDTPLPEVRSKDEIQLLRDSFDKMQQSLTLYVDELKITTIQKTAIDSELRIAHDIQMSMLPKTFPPYPDRDDVDLFGQVIPAKAIGGDLFDFFIREGQLIFCIGDVSGKGVPASLLMAVTRTLFRNVASTLDEPQQIVEALNRSVADKNEMNMFVTLFVGVLNLKTGDLRYCNAGHDAPLVISDEVTELPCDSNLPLGVMEDWQFTRQTTVLGRQATIFLFTDGLNEAENVNHEQFGNQRVMDIAHEVSASGNYCPADVVAKMADAVRTFVGGAEQSDDQTMLAIQYAPPAK